jgi:hypothetical protein
MAQLRDALTSELVAEGDPLELVQYADALGRDNFIFDGVGGDAFNPDEVLAVHQQQAEGLQAALDSSTDSEEKESIAQSLDAAQQALNVAADVNTVREIKSNQERARARHEPGHDDDEPEIVYNPELETQMPQETEPIPQEFTVDTGGSPKNVTKGK